MTPKKNIILFLNDDHAQWASGTYGNSELDTPNIDSLAATGIQMQNAYTPTPVCSPGRACLLTGRLASQHGVHDYLATADPEIDGRKWLEGELLLPEILAAHGYQTAYCGKWHLGQDDQHHAAFDYWFSISGDYPFRHNDTTRYCDNGTEHFIPGYTTRVITDHALTFLQDRDANRPFLLIVGYTATHSVWKGHPERLVSRYRSSSFRDVPLDEIYPFGDQALESALVDRSNQREALAQYYAAVSHLDEAVGHILDGLAANGLLEDTLVVYTSDHGLNCGHHGIWGKGNGTLPLNMVDESIRVPLIMSQPGCFAAGQRHDHFVDHTDLFQTLLDYSGSDLGETDRVERNYPGKSFLPLLESPSRILAWRDIQFGEYGPLRMVRTDRFKLVLRNPDGPHGLFDLDADPREMRDLYGDPAYGEIREGLTQEIDRFFGAYETAQNSGLRGAELPRHNNTEAWR
jgi:arylsulfatase A-like enzyme